MYTHFVVNRRAKKVFFHSKVTVTMIIYLFSCALFFSKLFEGKTIIQ